MAKVHKTIEQARKNLGDSVAYIPARYKESTSRADWEAPATSEESEANFTAGITEAIAKDSRRAGIRAVGNTKYRKGCADKGAGVIAGRITNALPDYVREFTPILGAMNSAADAAPPRTRDFRANITNRLIPVVEAARKAAGKD